MYLPSGVTVTVGQQIILSSPPAQLIITNSGARYGQISQQLSSLETEVLSTKSKTFN